MMSKPPPRKSEGLHISYRAIWEKPDGTHLAAWAEEAEEKGWSFVSLNAHADGNMDYFCGHSYCRCLN